MNCISKYFIEQQQLSLTDHIFTTYTPAILIEVLALSSARELIESRSLSLFSVKTSPLCVKRHQQQRFKREVLGLKKSGEKEGKGTVIAGAKKKHIYNVEKVLKDQITTPRAS